MKSFLIFLTAILFVILTTWVLMTYILISEEERIERTIERGRRAVEKGSIFTLQNLLAANYSDSSGMSREEITGALHNLFRETSERQINIITCHISIDETKQTAQASVKYTFQFQSSSNLMHHYLSKPSNTTRQVQIHLQKIGGRWKITQTLH